MPPINLAASSRWALVALASVLTVACSSGDAQTPGAGPQAAPAPTVGVVIAEETAVAITTELPGRTSAYVIAELRPQVTGLIKQRAFIEGSAVKAGDLLYEIDPASYTATYDSAKAALARAEASEDLARLTAQRFAGLAKSNVVSQQANDDAAVALKMAEADVAAARATLEQARINLDFTRLTSPIDGRIGRSAVTAGALVTANQAQALATVQQLDPIYVDLTQSSADMLRLRRDLDAGRLQQSDDGRVAVALELEDGVAYGEVGQLAFSEVSVDPGTGSVTLRAVFPNPRGELLPGMYVRAKLEQGVNADAILLPHAAVSRDPRGNATVMVVNEQDAVEVRIVRAERSLGDQWVVSEGLSAGERVIVEGLQRVRPGASVKVERVGAPNDGEQ